MDVPQGNLPQDATVIDTKQLRLLREIADLAENVADGKQFPPPGGYPRGPELKEMLRQRLIDLRILQSR